ncbi:flagellar hook-length control protein FliK [Jatrophihabitans sp. DSM 45814]
MGTLAMNTSIAGTFAFGSPGTAAATSGCSGTSGSTDGSSSDDGSTVESSSTFATTLADISQRDEGRADSGSDPATADSAPGMVAAHDGPGAPATGVTHRPLRSGAQDDSAGAESQAASTAATALTAQQINAVAIVPLTPTVQLDELTRSGLSITGDSSTGNSATGGGAALSRDPGNATSRVAATVAVSASGLSEAAPAALVSNETAALGLPAGGLAADGLAADGLNVHPSQSGASQSLGSAPGTEQPGANPAGLAGIQAGDAARIAAPSEGSAATTMVGPDDSLLHPAETGAPTTGIAGTPRSAARRTASNPVSASGTDTDQASGTFNSSATASNVTAIGTAAHIGNAAAITALTTHAGAQNSQTEKASFAVDPAVTTQYQNPRSPYPTGTSALPMTQQLSAPVLEMRARGDGVHRLLLDLHPADLGQVTVELRLHGGDMSISIAGGNDAAREAIRSALPELRGDLAAVGLAGAGISLDSGTADAFAGQGGQPGTFPPGRGSGAGQHQESANVLTDPRRSGLSGSIGPSDSSMTGIDRWL